MSDCQFNTDGPPWTCTRCGWTYARQTINGKPPSRRHCGKEKSKPINTAALTPAAAKLGITAADIGHYAAALARWTAAGFPVRSQVEVSRLEAVCRACEHYVDGRCRQCRCRVNVSRIAVINKIKMATERCAAGKW